MTISHLKLRVIIDTGTYTEICYKIENYEVADLRCEIFSQG